MDTSMVAARDALLVAFQIGAPPLLAMLAMGLVVAVLQALTQVNEATLAFLPKAIALAGVLVVMAPFMTLALRGHAERLFALIVLAGTAP